MRGASLLRSGENVLTLGESVMGLRKEAENEDKDERVIKADGGPFSAGKGGEVGLWCEKKRGENECIA